MRRPYLLTGGLVPLIKNRHKTSISPYAQEAIRNLEKMYFSATANLLNNRQETREDGTNYEWEVKFMSDEDIDSGLRRLILKERDTKPMISFDDVYCQDLADGNYHVTRLQDPSKLSDSPQLGPRFANPTLEVQIENIRKTYGEQIDVMDIGVFGGDTLAGEIDRFRKGGVRINNVFVMFAGQEGIQRIAKMDSNLKYVQDVDWIDWLEMRDCVGFDGRKVRMYGEKVDCSQNSFIRYTERSGQWASIPEEVKKHYEALYTSCFDTIKSILACDGVDADLIQSPENELVYNLKVGRK